MVNFQTDVLKIGPFSNRCLKICSISKQILKKNTPPQGAAAPWGRRRSRRQGYFFKIWLKMDRIFKHLFENGPYVGNPIFKIAIGLVFQNFTI